MAAGCLHSGGRVRWSGSAGSDQARRPASGWRGCSHHKPVDVSPTIEAPPLRAAALLVAFRVHSAQCVVGRWSWRSAGRGPGWQCGWWGRASPGAGGAAQTSCIGVGGRAGDGLRWPRMVS